MKMIEAKSVVQDKQENGTPAGTLEDLISEMEKEKSPDEESGSFDAEIVGDFGDPEAGQEYQGAPDPDAFDPEEEKEESSEPSDKDLANMLAVVIDVVFSAAWGFWSKADSREFRLDAKQRADIAKAAIPLMVSMKESLSPEWLFVVTVLALQAPNGMKANEMRKVNREKEQKRKTRNAEPVDFEDVTPPAPKDTTGKTFGTDGKKYPKVKKCSICGSVDHNKSTCPQNPKNKAKATA